MDNRLEFVSYDGSYPNLCSGKLVLRVDGVVTPFPDFCLSSGGNVWFDGDWGEHVEEGEWSLIEFPEGFPDKLKSAAEDLVNLHIASGCCGGCI